MTKGNTTTFFNPFLFAAGILVTNVFWLYFSGTAVFDRYLPSSRMSPLRVAATGAFAGLIPIAVVALSQNGLAGAAPRTGAQAALNSSMVFSLLAVGVSLFSLGWISIIIDLQTKLLPTTITVTVTYQISAAILIGMVWSNPSLHRVTELSLSALIWLMPLACGSYCFKQVGRGDVKLAPALGLALGNSSLSLAVLGFITAFVGSGLWALILTATKRGGRKSFAMGPFLLGATMLIWTADALGTSPLKV